MKNIFLVINKEKAYAYAVSVFTIVTLFVMSGMINSNFNETEQTSSNVELNTNSQVNNINANMTTDNINVNTTTKNSFGINTNIDTK